jgi:hypothetical protein
LRLMSRQHAGAGLDSRYSFSAEEEQALTTGDDSALRRMGVEERLTKGSRYGGRATSAGRRRRGRKAYRDREEFRIRTIAVVQDDVTDGVGAAPIQRLATPTPSSYNTLRTSGSGVVQPTPNT